MAIDAQWGNTVLLLPCSDDLLDARGHVMTASGGAALSSAVGNPFGAGNALYCDGTNDRLTATSSDFTLGTGDFSIQFWFYSVDGGHGANWGRLLTIGPGATTGGLYVVSSLNYNPMQVIIQSYASGAYNDVIDPVATTLSDDAWHFAQLDRVSGVFNFYVDNVLYDTKTVSRDLTRTELSLGANPDGTEAFKGYFSNVRITKVAYRTDHSIPSVPFLRPTIKGVVIDASAAPVAKRVIALKRSTQTVAGTALSDAGTGLYAIYPMDYSEHQLYRVDASTYPLVDGGSGENTLIYDRVIPGG